MTDPKTYRTASGRELTDADLDAIADEVEVLSFDVEALKTRRRGRPMLGSGPAEVVPVRIDPELKAAIDARAEADDTTLSEVIREALRRYLDVCRLRARCWPPSRRSQHGRPVYERVGNDRIPCGSSGLIGT
jgi:hypothetical protein